MVSVVDSNYVIPRLVFLFRLELLMPPIDFTIVKATVLYLVLPGAGLAALGAIVAVLFAAGDPRRSNIATIGLLLAMATGISLNKLVPFTEFETGWRSLFWVLTLAAVGEILLSNCLSALKPRSGIVETVSILLLSSLVSFLPMPVEEYRSQPWLLGLLITATLLNWLGLRVASVQRFGSLLPLALSFVWGGSAAAVLVLSGSARFGELAVLMSCVLGGIGVVAAVSGLKFESIYGGFSAFVPGLMLAGVLNSYSAVPKVSYILVAAAPAVFALLRHARVSAWVTKRPVLSAIFAVTPCVVAVSLAAKASASAPAPF